MRGAVDGNAVVEVEGRTLREALAHLVSRYPAVEGRLFTPDGSLHPHLMVVVDGVEAPSLYAPIQPNSEIIVIPAVGGGLRHRPAARRS